MSETPTDARLQEYFAMVEFGDPGAVQEFVMNLLAELAALRAYLHTAEQELVRLQDLPLCRQQVFNDGVPENTEQALRMWHRAAHNQANRADKAEAELAALQTGLAQLEQEMRDESVTSFAEWDYRARLPKIVARWADALHAARTRQP